ncbi:MAG: outer membrane beta-barrel protein, partial [Kiritimatiellae bacterium]|nr:outer membrane beta-barrel protein [Kiritimatiellia bacterium]
MKRISVIACLASCLFVAVQVSNAAESKDEGIKIGDYRLMPHADLMSIYDSNVETQPSNEKDDVSFRLKIGAGLENTAEKTKLKATLWGLSEKYIDLKHEDHDDFGESLDFQMLDLGRFNFGINESYEDIQSLDYAVGTIQARQLTRLGARAGAKITEKMNASLAYGFNDTAYESPRQYDWSEHVVSLLGLHDLTDKTAGKAIVAANFQSSDANVKDGTCVSALFGVKSKQTEKLTGEVGIGVMNLSGEADATRFAFDAGADWKAAEKVNVFLDARNGFEPSVLDANNYNLTTRATLGAEWAFVDSFSLMGSGAYARNDYLNPVVENDESMKKQDDTLTGTVRLTYHAPSKYLKIYLEGRYEDKNSTIDSNDYS